MRLSTEQWGRIWLDVVSIGGIALHYSTDVEIGRARNPEHHRRDVCYSTDVE